MDAKRKHVRQHRHQNRRKQPARPENMTMPLESIATLVHRGDIFGIREGSVSRVSETSAVGWGWRKQDDEQHEPKRQQ